MKEQFEEPVVEVITLDGPDIITASDSCSEPDMLAEIPG